jgi:hypothetical protein
MAPFTISHEEDQLHLHRRLMLGLTRAALCFCLALVAPVFFIWLAPNLWPFAPGRHVYWAIWVFLLLPFVVLLAGPLFDLSPLGRLGEHFVFDRGQDRLLRNGRHVARLRDILAEQVVNTGGRNPKTRVTLLLEDTPPLTLAEDSALLVWFADGCALGRRVGKFVGVPLVDNA